MRPRRAGLGWSARVEALANRNAGSGVVDLAVVRCEFCGDAYCAEGFRVHPSLLGFVCGCCWRLAGEVGEALRSWRREGWAS